MVQKKGIGCNFGEFLRFFKKAAVDVVLFFPLSTKLGVTTFIFKAASQRLAPGTFHDIKFLQNVLKNQERVEWPDVCWKKWKL